MPETILTGLTDELTEEQKEKSAIRKRDWDRYQILLDVMREAYEEGEIQLTHLCLWLVSISKNFEGNEIDGIPANIRNQQIGQLIVEAISKEPPKVSLKSPKELKRIIVGMVRLAKEDGYSLSLDSEVSAFRFIADEFNNMGVELTPRVIKEYWSSLRKPQ